MEKFNEVFKNEVYGWRKGRSLLAGFHDDSYYSLIYYYGGYCNRYYSLNNGVLSVSF